MKYYVQIEPKSKKTRELISLCVRGCVEYNLTWWCDNDVYFIGYDDKSKLGLFIGKLLQSTDGGWITSIEKVYYPRQWSHITEFHSS